MAANLKLVEEDQARGVVRTIFDDVRRTMDTPVVGDIFRAYAANPRLLEATWYQIKPVVGTTEFECLANRLRAHAMSCARQHCFVSDHRSALAANGTSDSEIERIRRTLEVFHQNDPRWLVIATVVRQSLGADIPVLDPLQTRREGIERAVPTALHPSGRELLDEFRDAIEADFVPSDFRAMTRWPQYLRLTWGEIRAQVRSADFRRRVREFGAIAASGTRDLASRIRPPVSKLDRREQAEVQQIVVGAQAFMPGLVTTIALMRLGMNAAAEDELLEMEAGA